MNLYSLYIVEHLSLLHIFINCFFKIVWMNNFVGILPGHEALCY